MKNYVEENKNILDEWEKFNEQQEDVPNFARDGIMYNYSGNDANDENMTWSNAPIRFLFITKDQNAKEGEAWDLRDDGEEEGIDLR